MCVTDEQISLYSAALQNLTQARDSEFPAAALTALIARDKVALSLRDEKDPASAAALDLLIKTDRRLVDLAPKFDSIGESGALDDWRRSTRPDENFWWWKLDDLAKAKQTWLKRVSTSSQQKMW